MYTSNVNRDELGVNNMDMNTLVETIGVDTLMQDDELEAVALEDVLEDADEEVLPAANRSEHLAKLAQYLKNLTPEQREEMRRKAEETRRLKKAYAEEHYQHVWQDDKLWKLMAKEAGVRLADHYTVPTPYNLAKFARQLDLPFSWKEALFGVNANKGTTFCLAQEFNQQPPGKKYNLRFYQGTMLEFKYGATFKNDYRIDDEEPEDLPDEAVATTI